MPLSQKEIDKIHEEEAERAKARQIYAHSEAPKKKMSCLAWGLLVLLIAFLVIVLMSIISICVLSLNSVQNKAQPAASNQTL